MRINELIIEDQETEEGVLGSIGRGVAAGLGGVARGAGMVAGVGTGMKKAFQKGKATSAAHIAGDVPKPAPTSNPDFDAEYARLTKPQPAAAAPAKAAPVQAQPAADSGDIQSQIAQKQKELADLQAKLKDAQAAKASQPAAQTAPATTAAKPAAPTGYSSVKMNAPTSNIPNVKYTMPSNMAVPKPKTQEPATATAESIDDIIKLSKMIAKH